VRIIRTRKNKLRRMMMPVSSGEEERFMKNEDGEKQAESSEL
jgi:hypothetical protein